MKTPSRLQELPLPSFYKPTHASAYGYGPNALHLQTDPVARQPSPAAPCVAPSYLRILSRKQPEAPDGVDEGRRAHHSTEEALGHGCQQSINCASHRWRAQSYAARPE